MIKTAWLALALMIAPGTGDLPPQERETVDVNGTNPTLGDTSFAKTVPPHRTEEGERFRGAAVDGSGADRWADGRWGDTGDSPASYRTAEAGRGHTGFSPGWLGLIGLAGLAARRPNEAKGPGDHSR
ncbi:MULTISPECIES: hypothetical protein [Paenibacillus]|uniref:hypothetical protein n=1 Tax=Paenibacillus TaxID=44249 RepID=UPI0022B8DF5F|nr:hypothetical protein [Paenibacillus caseinilyticus]MCZ8520422.1 hypothetical protein [Paenibacillus caseinilyticus]